MKSICYVTYQSFPSLKANTIQTMANLKYMVKNGYHVELIFPLREKFSSDNLNELKSFYNFTEDIKITGIKHSYPFGKIKFLEKIFFLFSHMAWSKKIVKEIQKVNTHSTSFMTRSEWIAYYLSKYELNVVYECHQSSKIKSFLIPFILKSKKSNIIFLNELLCKSFNIKNKHKKQINVLHNGVDTEFFQKGINMEKNSLVFVGNLLRFNKDRNVQFLIELFKNNPSLSQYKLKIIGGPEDERLKLDKQIFESNLQNKIKTFGPLNRKDTILEIQKSQIGLLINKSDNSHSTHFTSPLKYFEYLYGGLKIVAVDFPAHRNLPFSEKILFFSEDNQKEFIDCLKNSQNTISFAKNKLNTVSLDYRAKKIIEIIET